ncbi:MAG: DUF962 domain-containing protein [Bacteriovoracaceae bacterium]|nr:DUF962 domain-containing protein [Bacteriovoracaceae bacterium]
MKTLNQYLALYAESHQNKLNKNIHYICVPLIMWTVLVLLDFVSLPIGTLAYVLVILSFVFYNVIKTPVLDSLLMMILSLVMIALSRIFNDSRMHVAITIFVMAWIGQFVGHKIEGKKPSFFQDLLFLLIGPMWILQSFKRKD